LELSPEELSLYQGQLSQILDYFGRLQELDTEAIEPTASVLPLQSVMREDVARPGHPRGDMLANAPEAEDGVFLVPRVLD
jgi:aspartyl-tRNA(Asn)/glutamyl-tRNA(Gln) amidotransferase subunit C